MQLPAVDFGSSALSARALTTAIACTAGAAVAVRLLQLGTRWKLRTLSGPFALPVLGNLPAIVGTPGGFAAWRDVLFKLYGRIYRVFLGGLPVVVVSDPELVRKIAAQSNTRPNISRMIGGTGDDFYVAMHGLVTLSPEEHGQKFRAVRKAFDMAVLSPASLTAHEPMMQQCVERLVTRLTRVAQRGEPVDMVSILADTTMEVIGFAAFGVDLHCADVSDTDTAQNTAPPSDWVTKPGTVEFGRGLTAAARVLFRTMDPAAGSAWKIPSQLIPDLEKTTRFLSMRFPDQALKRELKARSDVHNAVRVLMKQWQDYQTAKQTKDTSVPFPAMSDRGFLAKLLEGAQSEGLSELDVIAQGFTMLLAGYETTATVLSSTLCLLQQDPKKQARLQTEVDSVLRGKKPTSEDMERMPYLRAVVDETLRMYAPADFVMRVLSEDMRLPDGKIIPAGMDVYLATRSLQMDHVIWPRADEYLPERWLPGNEDLAPRQANAYLPFGLGNRHCPGYKFALLEARLALASLAQHFTFSAAPGLPKTLWQSGIVYSPNCVWSNVSKRTSTVKSAEQ